MPFIAFLLLTLCQFLSGYGILTLFRIRLTTAFTITLSLLLGVAVASFVPFLLQLFYILLTGPLVFGALVLAALLLNIPTFLRIRREGFGTVRRSFIIGRFRLRPYEIPYLLILGFFVFVSVWRCYYLPPTSRDALSGPEAIAEYAVREHSMINSFFRVDLWSTNNPFKSPYLVSLQMIYKMAGFPFGQVWLSTIFISFTVFLYHALRQRVHPVIAGLLLLLLMMTPEMYAYTFMILYDYSNMVFFFLSLYFLFDYFNNRPSLAVPAGPIPAVPPADPAPAASPGIPRQVYLSGLLMGIATYIRSETLALSLLFVPLILLTQFREKVPVKKMLRTNALFIAPSLAAYYLTTQLYLKYYLPVHYDVGGLINTHLSDLHPLFQRYGEIITRLLTGVFATHLWGYIQYIFAVLFLAELLFLRRFSREARNWLYAIAALYIGIGILGWLLPMMNLLETTKRALFKLMPLFVLYLACNGWVTRLSVWISRWEGTAVKRKPSPVIAEGTAKGKSSPGKGAGSPASQKGTASAASGGKSSSKK
ncbi:MAG TPA: hypothetical protein VGM30_16110 [Puia sp.]|jgi:hypothetical protein